MGSVHGGQILTRSVTYSHPIEAAGQAIAHARAKRAELRDGGRLQSRRGGARPAERPATRPRRAAGASRRRNDSGGPRRALVAILVAIGALLLFLAASGAFSGPSASHTPDRSSRPDPSGTTSPSGHPSGLATEPPAGTATPGTTDTPPAPTLMAPDASVTSASTITVRGRLPGRAADFRRHRLRISVNDEIVYRERLDEHRGRGFTVGQIPISEGSNLITATLRGPDGLSAPSGAIEVVRDTVAPTITITAPVPGERVTTARAEIAGTTEGGASVHATNRRTGRSTAIVADASGAFQLTLAFEMGANEVALTSTDRAGNEGTTTYQVTRGTGKPRARLELSQRAFQISALPRELRLEMRVMDAANLPVNDVPVTFSVSPPGQPTSTLQVVTANGLAEWALLLPQDDAAAGEGFATGSVTLPDGTVLQETVYFVFR